MLNLNNYEFTVLALLEHCKSSNEKLISTLNLSIFYVKGLIDFDVNVQGFLPFKLLIEKQINEILEKIYQILQVKCNGKSEDLCENDQIIYLLALFDIATLYFSIAQFDSVQNGLIQKMLFDVMNSISLKLMPSLYKFAIESSEQNQRK